MVRWRWRKEGPSVQGFKASLGNVVRPCLRREGRIERRREGGRKRREGNGRERRGEGQPLQPLH